MAESRQLKAEPLPCSLHPVQGLLRWMVKGGISTCSLPALNPQVRWDGLQVWVTALVVSANQFAFWCIKLSLHSERPQAVGDAMKSIR